MVGLFWLSKSLNFALDGRRHLNNDIYFENKNICIPWNRPYLWIQKFFNKEGSVVHATLWISYKGPKTLQKLFSWGKWTLWFLWHWPYPWTSQLLKNRGKHIDHVPRWIKSGGPKTLSTYIFSGTIGPSVSQEIFPASYSHNESKKRGGWSCRFCLSKHFALGDVDYQTTIYPGPIIPSSFPEIGLTHTSTWFINKEGFPVDSFSSFISQGGQKTPQKPYFFDQSCLILPFTRII